MRTLIGICLSWCLLVSSLSAHQFWIRPSAFSTRAGGDTLARLFVGDGFAKGEVFPRAASHLKRFRVWDASGVRSVPGVEGRDPAGVVRLSAPGFAALGYESHPSYVTLDGPKFNRYLQEEGLDHALKTRAEAGHLKRSAIESFRRCAKTILRVTTSRVSDKPPRGLAVDRALGLDLEFIAETSPFADPSQPLRVRVELHGKPLPGIKIRAFREGAPRTKVLARTDAAGRAELELDARGVWMLSAVHIADASEKEPGGRRASEKRSADWRSIWTSLTFDSTEAEVAEAVVSK